MRASDMKDSQTIFRIHRKPGEWTAVLNETIRDPRLSFRATGLLVYLLSLPSDWTIRLTQICAAKKTGECEKGEGRDAVMAALKELRSYGYVSKEFNREKGRITGTVWNVFEQPENNRLTENPSNGHRLTGKPSDGFTEFGESATTKEQIQDYKRKNGAEAPDDLFLMDDDERKAMEKEVPFLALFGHRDYNPLLAKPGFGDAWRDYVNDRKECGKPLGKTYAKRLLSLLAKRPDEAAEALVMAFEERWKGVKWDWFDNKKKRNSIGANTPNGKAPPPKIQRVGDLARARRAKTFSTPELL